MKEMSNAILRALCCLFPSPHGIFEYTFSDVPLPLMPVFQSSETRLRNCARE